jgi:hypothetical protein
MGPCAPGASDANSLLGVIPARGAHIVAAWNAESAPVQSEPNWSCMFELDWNVLTRASSICCITASTQNLSDPTEKRKARGEKLATSNAVLEGLMMFDVCHAGLGMYWNDLGCMHQGSRMVLDGLAGCWWVFMGGVEGLSEPTR